MSSWISFLRVDEAGKLEKVVQHLKHLTSIQHGTRQAIRKQNVQTSGL